MDFGSRVPRIFSLSFLFFPLLLLARSPKRDRTCITGVRNCIFTEATNEAGNACSTEEKCLTSRSLEAETGDEPAKTQEEARRAEGRNRGE